MVLFRFSAGVGFMRIYREKNPKQNYIGRSWCNCLSGTPQATEALRVCKQSWVEAPARQARPQEKLGAVLTSCSLRTKRAIELGPCTIHLYDLDKEYGPLIPFQGHLVLEVEAFADGRSLEIVSCSSLLCS